MIYIDKNIIEDKLLLFITTQEPTAVKLVLYDVKRNIIEIDGVVEEKDGNYLLCSFAYSSFANMQKGEYEYILYNETKTNIIRKGILKII